MPEILLPTATKQEEIKTEVSQIQTKVTDVQAKVSTVQSTVNTINTSVGTKTESANAEGSVHAKLKDIKSAINTVRKNSSSGVAKYYDPPYEKGIVINVSGEGKFLLLTQSASYQGGNSVKFKLTVDGVTLIDGTDWIKASHSASSTAIAIPNGTGGTDIMTLNSKSDALSVNESFYLSFSSSLILELIEPSGSSGKSSCGGIVVLK